MAHCVFRCVENRVPAVRCANNGVSCFIDHLGEIQHELRDGDGNTFTHGHLTQWSLVPQAERPLTFYTRHGDLFAWACVAVSGLWGATVGVSTLNRRRKRAISTGDGAGPGGLNRVPAETERNHRDGTPGTPSPADPDPPRTKPAEED